MIFLSMPGELDTAGVAAQAWRAGKRVLAPHIRTDGDSTHADTMRAREIRSLTEGVCVGPLGARQPVDGPPTPIAEIDLVIVPGLAFDVNGNRLGRGRGFYDRFLGDPGFRGVACGLACEEQVVAAVPCEERDVRVHLLVTDERVMRFARKC